MGQPGSRESDKCSAAPGSGALPTLLPTLLPAVSRHTTVHHSQQSNIKTTCPGVLGCVITYLQHYDNQEFGVLLDISEIF